MAQKFLSVINAPQLALDPNTATSTAGDLYVRSTDSVIRLFDGTKWLTIGDVADPFAELWQALARVMLALQFLGVNPLLFSAADIESVIPLIGG